MDGRHERSARTRSLILQATLDDPSADIASIARAAKTTKRTLFRLFGDVGSLRRDAAELGLASAPLRSGNERVPSFVACVSEPYVRLGALLVCVPDLLALRQHELLRLHFRQDLYPLQVHSLCAFTSWPSWQVLVDQRGCSEVAARRVLEIGVKRLLK